LAGFGGAKERVERTRLAERIGPAEQRLPVAPDCPTEVLELELVEVLGLEGRLDTVADDRDRP
jgi:hypothetical protein